MLERASEEGVAMHSTVLVWRIPKDRGAWQAIVHGVAKSWTRLKRLSTLKRIKQVFLNFCKSNRFVNSLAIAVFNSIIRSAIKPFSAQSLLIYFEWTICFLFLFTVLFEEHWPFELNNVLTLGFRFFLLPRAAIFLSLFSSLLLCFDYGMCPLCQL